MDNIIVVVTVLCRYFIIVLGKILPFIIIFALYVAGKLYALKHLTYKRYFSVEGEFEGQEVELIEEISNNTFFPLFFIDVQSYVNKYIFLYGIPQKDNSEIQLFISRFNIMPFMTIKRKHRALCKKRGKYSLETAEIVYFKKTFTLKSEAPIYIYPAPLQKEYTGWAECFLQMTDYSMLPLFEDPFEFSYVREYRRGDAFNRINFKKTAQRGDALYVNQTEYLIGRREMIYLNFETSSDYTMEEYQSYMERGLSYSSYFLEQALNKGYEIGFSANCKMFYGDKFLRYPIGKVETADIYQMLLKQMSCVRLSRGMSIASMIAMDIEENLTNTKIILMTLTMDEKTEETLRILESMGNTVNVFWLEEKGV